MRILLSLVIFMVTLLLTVTVLAMVFPEPLHTVSPNSPDPRVRWVPYPVGGYGLCKSDTCITIPPGSMLVVPVPVPETPDSVATPERT